MPAASRTDKPKVSIIIPVKSFNPYLMECLEALGDLNYENQEIIVLPDFDLVESIPDIRVVPTGKIGPSKKRDIGVSKAEGDIIAFLDDDTYPRDDWLKHAVERFESTEVAAVGGPAVTPDSDSVWQKASGAVFTSRLGGGLARLRYMPLEACEVDDFPSCNLLMRKVDFISAGGFNTDFWPGEDTELCLRVIRDLKKKIVYEPRALVFHHRRRLFMPHLRQVYAYALHRGYFVKRHPGNSRRLAYFIPSVFVLAALTCFVIAALFPGLRLPLAAIAGSYMILVIMDGLYGNTLKVGLLAGVGIIATHFTYGFGFIHGLLARRMREESTE